MESEQVDGSTFIWALMAVSGLWLLGLLSIAIGYTLFACIGPCRQPASSWVWGASLVVAAAAFAMSGRVGRRMTAWSWAWWAALPGAVLIAVLAVTN